MIQKLYYSMAEAQNYIEEATGCKPNASTLRYWERSLSLTIAKNSNGKRKYILADLVLLLAIFNLLYKYSISLRGVKKLFRSKELRTLLGTFLLMEDFEFKALEDVRKM